MATEKESGSYPHAIEVLHRIERRISSLEKDATYIESRLDLLDHAIVKKKSNLNGSLDELHAALRATKEELRAHIAQMMTLTGELKNCLKEEQVKHIHEKVDEIAFESYVTQKDIKRGI